jgi:hypothetical protein
MTPNSWVDAIIVVTYVLLSGLGFLVSRFVVRLRSSRSEHRRQQRLTEMARVFLAVADWERSGAGTRERS